MFITPLTFKYSKNHQLYNTDNILNFKFDDMSIHTNIKANFYNTKLQNSNLVCSLFVRLRQHM